MFPRVIRLCQHSCFWVRPCRNLSRARIRIWVCSYNRAGWTETWRAWSTSNASAGNLLSRIDVNCEALSFHFGGVYFHCPEHPLPLHAAEVNGGVSERWCRRHDGIWQGEINVARTAEASASSAPEAAPEISCSTCSTC